MSDDVAQPSGEDVLHLTTCPWCDYSLATLPPQGICPECGGRYDQRFIILTGRGRGRFDSALAGTWRGLAWQIPLLAFACWMFANLRNAQNNPLALAFALLIVGNFIVAMYGRLFSARDPGMQLWLAPEGAAQIFSTPESRQAQRFSSYLALLFYPLIVVLALVFRAQVATVIVFSCLFVVVLALMLRRQLQWNAKRSRRGSALSGLWPWEQMDKTEVITLEDDHVRIRFERTDYLGPIKLKREPVVDIEVELTAPQAGKLRDQIAQWTSFRQDAKSKTDDLKIS